VENKLASLLGVTMGKALKGLVHCFSMQVVMIKCFLLNPKKFEKNAPLILKTDVTKP